MSQPTTQFISRMKLRELHRQRAKLREAYERLGAEASADLPPAERLRRLYDGLRGLKFAGQPLHPELANLEVLLHSADLGAASPETLSLWIDRLEEERRAGRTRSEFVYLFGALLEEWSREGGGDEALREESRREHARLLEAARSGPTPNRHGEIVDPLFGGLGESLDDLAGRVREVARDGIGPYLAAGMIVSPLERIADDIYRPPGLRSEARRFAGDARLRKELADALAILASELDDWDWPAEGLATRALWTRNKWRLYLDEDLPTACLLEILGDHWSSIFRQTIGDAESEAGKHRARLKKLLDLGAPEVIVANERRMIREAERLVGFGGSASMDPWREGEGDDDLGEDEDGPPEGGCIIEWRADSQASLRNFRGQGGYAGGEYDNINQAVLLVNAEVRLARAAYPDRPLFIAKADIRDYFARIPHDLLLTILGRIGVPESDLAFFARFLSPPIRGEDGQAPARMGRGVPMGHVLSGALAELPMRLLEQFVQRRARVRIIRLVDDIALLAPDAAEVARAWEAIGEFAASCGLEVNAEKSGAAAIGGELPDALPPPLPRWGMLELDGRGEWRVHAGTFDAHREQSRRRVEAAPSVFSRVQAYNANLQFLANALVLGGRLGEAHRASAERAVRDYHQDFFGQSRGIVSGLGEMIRERFRPDDGQGAAIPEGWIYWPVTAGGLGLKDPLISIGQYAQAESQRKPEPAPKSREAGWDREQNEWATFYQQFLEAIEPAEPAHTKVMKALVDDFIARGKEISAGEQEGLAPYWRWVLSTYGPQILRSFGTFRFLITELVPIQLISRQLVQDSSLGDSAGDEGDEGDE